MFDNIEDFYRVATQQDIEEFKQLSVVSCGSGLKVGDNNLKMLAIINDDDDIDLNSNIFKSKLLTTYSDYPNQDFQVENGQFIINTNKQLTSFLKLALGRLYTNPMSNSKMEASSAKKLT